MIIVFLYSFFLSESNRVLRQMNDDNKSPNPTLHKISNKKLYENAQEFIQKKT